MVLSDEDEKQLVATNRRNAQCDSPPTIPLTLILKSAVGGVFAVAATNLLSYLPQILITGYEYLMSIGEYGGATALYFGWNVLRLFIYSAFTKYFTKMLRQDNHPDLPPNYVPHVYDVQNTIVLPYLILIYELYTSDISFHLLYRSQSTLIYAIGLAGNHAFDLLQIIYAYRQDVKLRSGKSLDVAINQLWKGRQSTQVAPATSFEHQNKTEKEEPANTSTVPQAVTISNTTIDVSSEQYNTDTAVSKVFETIERRPGGNIHNSMAKQPSTENFHSLNKPTKKADLGGSSMFESVLQNRYITRDIAHAVTVRAAETINTMTETQAKLAPFMWVGRFTALLLSSVRFAVYGSATAASNLQENQPVTKSLLFSPLSAVKYDSDVVAFR
ncbi:hypothetical protein HDV05_008045, partial [Chytridiales sp. JEL 0842]